MKKGVRRILALDGALHPFAEAIEGRTALFYEKKRELCGRGGRLSDFANGYLYFGFHLTDVGWVYREWAPAAEAMFLTGDFNGWALYDTPMKKEKNGQ